MTGKSQGLRGDQIPISAHLEPIKTMSGHLVPVLRLADTNDDFEFFGSAVYINRDDRHFLATANHVIEGMDPSRVLLLTTPDGASSIPTRSCISTNDEKGDVALYELTEPLAHFTPIDYESIHDPSDEHAVLYMIGIPATRVSRRSRGQIQFEHRAVISRVLKDGGRHFRNFDDLANFVCDFKKEQIPTVTGQVVTFPDPYGMSGGPVFEAFYSEDHSLLRYNLAGIMTEWNPEKKRYIRCTRSSLLRFMVDSLWIT